MSLLNLTESLERLITDIAGRINEFRHIDPARVLVCVSSGKNSGKHGTYARIHPLRFAQGARTQEFQRGRNTWVWTMPTINHRGNEMRYVIYFLFPRFFNLTFREKLLTVFHELYHISPAFDGDLRRFPGRNYAHGSSRKKYDALVSHFVEEYLQHPDTAECLSFLDGSIEQLRGRYRTLVGRKYRVPKITAARLDN